MSFEFRLEKKPSAKGRERKKRKKTVSPRTGSISPCVRSARGGCERASRNSDLNGDRGNERREGLASSYDFSKGRVFFFRRSTLFTFFRRGIRKKKQNPRFQFAASSSPQLFLCSPPGAPIDATHDSDVIRGEKGPTGTMESRKSRRKGASVASGETAGEDTGSPLMSTVAQ